MNQECTLNEPSSTQVSGQTENSGGMISSCRNARSGAPAAYPRSLEPSWVVGVTYAYREIGRQDPARYAAISGSPLPFEGERIDASIMYDRGHEKLVDDWARMPPSTVLGAHLATTERSRSQLAELLAKLRARLDAHLYCLEIRQLTEIQTFAGIRADDVDSILARLVVDNILFQEATKFLSLAVASDRVIATHRIRWASEARQDSASASKHRLMVVG